MRTMYILRTDDRPTDLAFWKTLNGYISATDHPIDFVFDPRFSGTADRMHLLSVVPNPRFGRPPSWKISNDHIFGMSYPPIEEKIMREE